MAPLPVGDEGRGETGAAPDVSLGQAEDSAVADGGLEDADVGGGAAGEGDGHG